MIWLPQSKPSVEHIVYIWSCDEIDTTEQRLKIVKLQSSSRRSLSFIGRRHSYSSNDSTSYSYCSWLVEVPCSLEPVIQNRASVHKKDWTSESRRCFIRSLSRIIDSVQSRDRSVWLMVRPLERRVPSPSGIKPAFGHWGAVISELTKLQLDERISSVSEHSSETLGTLHELRNDGGITRYVVTPYDVHCKPLPGRDYVGQTEMNNEEIFNFGTLFIYEI
jgi:hypothetical protein